MDKRATIDHAAIAETLPDYAVGALDDVTAERVARHLAGCEGCRDHLALLLETVGLLAPARPPAATKRALLARAVVDRPGIAPPPGAIVAPLRVLTPPPSSPPRRSGSWLRRVAPVWLAAALLVSPLAGWGLAWERRQDERDDLISRLANNPAAAHPLNESELPPGPVGILYAAPTEDRGVLVARGLPQLANDQLYHVWLVTDDGEQQILSGVFDVDDEGKGRAYLSAPAPFDSYLAAAVSAGPLAGGQSPTSSLKALGGIIEDSSASSA